MKISPLLLVFLLLPCQSNCANTFVSDDIITQPSPRLFSVCFNNTCDTVKNVGLTHQQWQHIRAYFSPAPSTPQQERQLIRRAIAQLEHYVGELTGTSSDQAKNNGGGMEGQMDCIDESTNSTIYLLMFKRDNLLRWHTVEERVTRGFFITGWPHTTAVIHDTQNNQRYAVDSWFLENGEPPYIIPLQQWQDGWQPSR